MWWRLKETSVSALKLHSELPAWWKYFHKVMCIPSPLAHIFWVYALDTIDKNHIFCIFAESVAPHANTITWRAHLNFMLSVWWWMNHTDVKSGAFSIRSLKWTYKVFSVYFTSVMWHVFELNNIQLQKCNVELDIINKAFIR